MFISYLLCKRSRNLTAFNLLHILLFFNMWDLRAVKSIIEYKSKYTHARMHTCNGEKFHSELHATDITRYWKRKPWETLLLETSLREETKWQFIPETWMRCLVVTLKADGRSREERWPPAYVLGALFTLFSTPFQNKDAWTSVHKQTLNKGEQLGG